MTTVENRRPAAMWLVLSVCIVLADQLSKDYITRHFGEFEFISVLPVLDITRMHNVGAAFSFLAESHSQWRGVFLVGVSLVVTTIIGIMLFRPAVKKSLMLEIALALVLGGAAGNLWDRLFRGTVTDFLQLFFGSYEYPSFNVADSAIFTGACLLMLDLWKNRAKS